MDTNKKKLGCLLDRLEDNLDDVEDAFRPLRNMSETALALPLLERAKLYTLATYSLESLLFSALKLNGTNPKEHAVFGEIARVRQYFDKIAKAEAPPPETSARPVEQTLDTQAAIRFIKSDLVRPWLVSQKALSFFVAQPLSSRELCSSPFKCSLPTVRPTTRTCRLN